MAINPETAFAGKITPSTAAYPYGSARNITVPGDGTGTPFVAQLVNDNFGLQQALLSRAGIVPTGAADTAENSQYFDALESLFARKTVNVTTLKSSVQAEGSIVETLGYYDFVVSKNPVGGAKYLIMSAADYLALTGSATPDGFADHLRSDGTIARLIVGNTLDVTQTGARGDGGVTACFDPVQEALKRSRYVTFTPTDSFYDIGDEARFEFDNTTVDLRGATVHNTAAVTSQAALHFNGKNSCVIKNGIMRVDSGDGVSILNDLAANDLTVDNIQFQRGAVACTIQTTDANYPDVVTNVKILNCTHDGENLGGGFFSCQNARGVIIQNCKGKNGSEFFDLNNNVEDVRVSGCISENYLSNHWDINSTRRATFVGNIVISTVGGITSRAVWVSDRTSASDPVSMPDSEKVSHDIVMSNNIFIIDNHDYTEFMIWNSGAQDTPPDEQFYTFTDNIIKCLEYYDFSKFPFQGALASYVIAKNHFINCGIEVNCDHGAVNDNRFEYTGAELPQANVKLDNWTSGEFSNNTFKGYTGTADSPTGGVVLVEDCTDVLLSKNNFVATTDCAAFFTENGTNKNTYIENRYSVNVTRPGGVRNTSNDGKVIYDATLVKRDTFVSGDTTPSVLGSNVWKTANAVPTTISNFDDGFASQQVTVIFNDNNTTVDFTGTALHGNGGVDWTPSQYDSMICLYDNSTGRWHCVVSG